MLKHDLAGVGQPDPRALDPLNHVAGSVEALEDAWQVGRRNPDPRSRTASTAHVPPAESSRPIAKTIGPPRGLYLIAFDKRLARTRSRRKPSQQSVAWSPDSQRLATGCADKIVRIWDLDPN